LREIIHDLCKAAAFGCRYPFESQSLGIEPDQRQQFPAQMHQAQGKVIALGDVVALARPTAADEYPVFSIGKRTEHTCQVNSAGAHDTNNLDIRRILLSGNSSQVRGGITSPIAEEAQYFGPELTRRRHYSLPLMSPIMYQCKAALPILFSIRPHRSG
jgi:hypothetical protein